MLYDQTIVSTAIKTIGNDLNNLSAQAWVTTAFLITSTIAAPLFGKLSDLFGRKRLFMLASLACGQVTSRTGRYKIFPVIGSALLVVGLGLMSQMRTTSTPSAVRDRCSVTPPGRPG